MLRVLSLLSAWTASLLCGLAVLAAIAVGVLALEGYRMLPVVSGSMAPALPEGSIIAVKAQPEAELAVGDAVTFRHPLSADKMITHRLHQAVDEDGLRAWRTKGDANPVVDPWLIRLPAQTPTVRFAVPYAGYPLLYLSGPLARWLLLGLAASLLLLVALRAIWRRAPDKADKAETPREPAWAPRRSSVSRGERALQAGLVGVICLSLSVIVFGAPTLAGFSAVPITPPDSTLSVDRLANHFAATPGSDVVVGSSTPVAAGDVDTMSLAFGLVPSARTFSDVFVVSNPTSQPQAAVLELLGPSQVAAATFADGQTTATLAPGGQATVRVTTSTASSGTGTGSVRLYLEGQAWMYRDYVLTLEQAPTAPTSLTATASASQVDLSWTASPTASVSYNVYRKSGGAYVKLNGAPVSGTSYADSAASAGTTYYYVVRAYDGSRESLDSNEVSATLVAGCSSPGVQTVNADADTWVNEAAPALNYGTWTAMYVSSKSNSDNRRSLVHFAIPATPSGCTLTAATLKIYAYSGDAGRVIQVYRAASSWGETTVTWASQPALGGTAATLTSGSYGAYVGWNVLAHVQAGAGNGFVLKDSVESKSGPAALQTYITRENLSILPPKLELTFG